MTPLTALEAAYQTLKTGTLWSSTGKCRGYAAANPGEAAKIDAYVAALVAGGDPVPPVLATATGQGIVGIIAAGFPYVPPAPSTNPVPPPAAGAFFCAYVEGASTYGYHFPAKAPWSNAPGDWTAEGLSNPWPPQFELDAGKKIWGLMFGESGFFTNPGDYDGNFAYVKAQGAVPVVDVQTSNSNMTLADIAAGKYDTQLTAIGKGASTLGPFILRIDAEMNGDWYPFGVEIRASAQGPSNFVAAWQRIVTLFRAAGATNVAFHWCPNVDVQDPTNPPYPTLESLYPGDAYVDWAGFTGYNEGNATLDQVYNGAYSGGVLVAPSASGTYARVVKLTTKPIMIGETSSVDVGFAGEKVAFINDFFSKLPTEYPQVRAFCWFNWRTNEHTPPWDWEIESSPASQAAFQAGVAAPYFVGRP